MNGAWAQRAFRLGTSACLAVVLLGCGLAGAETTRLPITSFGGLQEPSAIDVDQASGDIYVVDVGAASVRRFDSSFQNKPFSTLGTNTIDGAGSGNCPGVSQACDETPAGGFALGGGAMVQVAVDDSGNPLTAGDVYVTDPFHGVVDVFDSSGTYIGQLAHSGGAGPAFGGPCGVAVGPTGKVYVADAWQGTIHIFVPSGNPPSDADFVSDLAFTEPCAVAPGAAATAGALMVNRPFGGVFKLDELGALQYQVGTGTSRGVAVDPSTGDVLTASESSAFEYDASSGSGATLVAKFGARRFREAAGVAVDGDLERAYVSDRSNGRIDVFGPLVPLPLPSVRLAPYTPSAYGVLLRGFVGSYAEPSEFHFEYGTEDCATSTCTSVPAGPGPLPEGSIGNGPVPVSRSITGLTPGTTYYYRLVASNPAGPATSESGTFKTLLPSVPDSCPNQQIREEQAAGKLPDCRGYELVSQVPADARNGADVFLSTQLVQAASGGDAFRFAFTAGAGDTEAAPPAPEFVARREAPGVWTVHGVTPPQPAQTIFDLFLGRTPHFQGDMSADLTKGVFLSNALLNEEGPNVREVPNLYLRTDLLSSGPGSYGLLTDADSPQTFNREMRAPSFAGASSDFSHVFFESELNLVPAATALAEGPRLYEWASGTVRLASVLPASEGGGPTLAVAGQGAEQHYASQAVSRDGSRVVFTAPPFAFGRTRGNLYMRDDHGTADTADDATVRINASEKTNGAGPGGVDPSGTQPAAFWAGSSNLNDLFFTSSEALTDDAPVSSGTSKLYRYAVEAPAGHHLTLLSVDLNAEDGITDEADGVIGSSEDGTYVYFVASNQLEPDASTVARPRIFLWHAGGVREVAGLNGEAESRQVLGSDGWAGKPKWSRVTPDGRHLTFVTEGSPELPGFNEGTACPAGASTGCQEVYLYDAGGGNDLGSLQCVSCNPTGAAATVDADFNLFVESFLLPKGPHLNQPLAEDGGTEFFSTAERLETADKNGRSDVYSFDAATGEVRLVSRAAPDSDSYFLDATPDGGSAFFATRDDLLPRDGNDQTDVYSARVDGGASEPPPAPAFFCDSEGSCRSPSAAGTDDSIPATAAAEAKSVQRKHRRARHRRRHGKHRVGKHRRGGHR